MCLERRRGGGSGDAPAWRRFSGDETLGYVRFSLQVPGGWKVQSIGRSTFDNVAPSAGPTATFAVTPPSWATAANEVIHATARSFTQPRR